MSTPTERTTTAYCSRGECGSCGGVNMTATGWNWWCTHSCHPEPVPAHPLHQPALDFWRQHAGPRRIKPEGDTTDDR